MLKFIAYYGYLTGCKWDGLMVRGGFEGWRDEGSWKDGWWTSGCRRWADRLAPDSKWGSRLFIRTDLLVDMPGPRACRGEASRKDVVPQALTKRSSPRADQRQGSCSSLKAQHIVEYELKSASKMVKTTGPS